MMSKVLVQENNSRKNLEAIENYLCCDEEDRAGLELTPKQQELFERWSFADDQLRRDRYKHEEVVQMLITKFGISNSSAWDDLRHAQIVFGSSNALNKRYTAYAQVRRLENMIRFCRNARDFKSAADFEKILQKAIAALPDTQAPKSARVINFNIQNNNNAFTASEQDITDAVKAAEEYLDYTIEDDAEDT